MHVPERPTLVLMRLAAVVALAILPFSADARSQAGQTEARATRASSRQLGDRLDARVHESEHGALPYRIFEPAGAGDAGEESGAKYPLVLFLHGAGERGSDNRRQLVHGVSDFVSPERQAKHPCYLVAPQCPSGLWWLAKDVHAGYIDLLRTLCDRYPVDEDRVYVTGLSMGGYATWQAIAADPDLFAAAVPICGGGDPKTAGSVARLPIWAFHGGDDKTVPAQKSKDMIEAIRAAGGQPKYTEYPGVGHNSWSRTYADDEVHEWLFAQRRDGAPAEPVAGPAPEPLKDGDRIAFFGDSITAAGAREGGYIRLIEAGLRGQLPDLEIELIGAGISGHRVPDLRARLDRDVLSKKPSIVVIYIGINDVWHWKQNRGTEKADFDAGLRDLVAKLHAAGARVILCTPSVIGEKTDGSNEFDAMLEEYSALSRQVAADTGARLLDLRALFLAHLRDHNPDNAAKGVLTGDGVHLNAAGNRFVADRMLEAFGLRPGGR